MKARLWGTRGSLSRAGPDTVRYGGDTACVEVRDEEGGLLVLDAGSGILSLGASLDDSQERIDILISHLHMDHIQGLGFFPPLYSPDIEVHLWGPASAEFDLHTRLTRYMSPPLFPVRLRDLPNVWVHDLVPGRYEIGAITVETDLIIHPGHSLGFCLRDDTGSIAYMSDHEPALGARVFPGDPEWTSGHYLASGADLLIHDAQYTDEEYAIRVGWGHSTFSQAIAFAEMAGVDKLITFHHDPSHSDDFLDEVAATLHSATVTIVPGRVGDLFDLAA